jgi:signal transduction histidine kinase
MRYGKTVSIHDRAFQLIHNEILVAIKLNGEFVYKNSKAESLFTTNNFFDFFEEGTKEEIFNFIQRAVTIGDIVKQSFLIGRQMLQLKGVFKEQLIYLSGLIDESITIKHHLHNEKLADWSWNAYKIGVIGINTKDEIVVCNNQCLEYLQLPSTDIMGKDYLLSLHTSPLIELIENMVTEVRNNKEFNIERYYYEEDDFYQLQTYYTDNDNNIIYIFISDQTYRQQFENLLLYKRQMESVSHLAAGVAHEIRNPLSVIKGFIQLAKHTKNIDQFYETVLSEIDRMNEILEDFLAVSKKTKIKKEIHKPERIIQSILSIIQTECLLHDINFHYKYDPNNCFVKVDEGMIKQVILNLLRNAVEAFGDLNNNREKEIYLTAFHKDDQYFIRLRDNGPGMDQGILSQLGKPFYTTKQKGTGIGIPLCIKIVEDHGGKFMVDSDLESGTTITFSLPLINLN